jgi:hypothetical protein
MTDHRNAGVNTRRPGVPLGSRPDKGGHVLPHVGKGGLTNPKLAARRDQSAPTVNPPRGPNVVLQPSKPPKL